MERIKISLHGRAGHVMGNLITPPGPSNSEKVPGILIVPGWRGSAKGYTDQAVELSTMLGFVVFVIDLRGHGEDSENFGRYSRPDHLADIGHAYTYLHHHRNVDPGRIIGVGASYGAYLLTILSRKFPFAGLALRIPASYSDSRWPIPMAKLAETERGKKERRAFRRRLAPKRNRGFDSMRRFRGEVLIISAGMDTDVPSQTIENWLEAAGHVSGRVRHLVIKKAGHSFKPEDHVVYRRHVAKWLQRFL